jgi:hypothetical protein
MIRLFMLFLVSLFSLAVIASAQNVMPSLTEFGDGWNVIKTDGVCSTGTPYQFYVKRRMGSNKLLIYFNGGGACWFGQQCDLKAKPNTHFPFANMKENDPRTASGLFAQDNAENPFLDYNMVSLPYCTGDVHVGAGKKTYAYTDAAGKKVEVPTFHVGYQNSTTVLNWVYKNFQSPQRIIVAGSSAGAIGSSFYSGLIAERYPSVPVVLLADAAGGYNSPRLPVVFKAWNTASILPNWKEYTGETNESLTFEDFYIASANHNKNLTIAQYNAAGDQVQINFCLLLGDPPDSFKIQQRILHHYTEIESAVDIFYSYTPGGKVHTILRSPEFYTYKVEGIRFVDWIADLAAGKPVGDISCVDEPEGCAAAPK